MEACAADRVRIVSRRMVRPSSPTKADTTNGHAPPSEEAEDIHLTSWDLRLISVDYIQKGILLPKSPAGGKRLVDTLASSFARALGRYYPFAGRLDVEERGDGTVTVPLRCTGEGAEFIHATAPGVTVMDIVGSIYTPAVVWSFYPLNEVLGADAAIESYPVLSVQVTELADGVFIGMSMNHSVGDGTTFWEFFNTWSEINRGGISDDLREISTPAPVLRRWFIDTSPVPIPMPFSKLQHIVRRFERPTVQECFFTFSAASVKKLKARANDEMAGTATATISSLQALLAHLWRAVSRARGLPPGRETFYSLLVGCRGRVNGRGGFGPMATWAPARGVQKNAMYSSGIYSPARGNIISIQPSSPSPLSPLPSAALPVSARKAHTRSAARAQPIHSPLGLTRSAIPGAETPSRPRSLDCSAARNFPIPPDSPESPIAQPLRQTLTPEISPRHLADAAARRLVPAPHSSRPAPPPGAAHLRIFSARPASQRRPSSRPAPPPGAGAPPLFRLLYGSSDLLGLSLPRLPAPARRPSSDLPGAAPPPVAARPPEIWNDWKSGRSR